MVVSEDPATARATQSSDVYTRRDAAWAGEAGGVDTVAQTSKTDAQKWISLMELNEQAQLHGNRDSRARSALTSSRLPQTSVEKRWK
jgi:hypothetical protein